MTQVKLTPRLEAVLSLVPKAKVYCDIGTDHGYIAIALAKRGGRVIAADINKGPLANAERNIERSGLRGSIETRISDGFSNIGFGEADCAVIGGMGGELIMNILKKGDKSVKCLVLQPQSMLRELRSYLADSGYIIEDEELCIEKGRYYAAMRVRRGETRPLSEAEKQLGPVLIYKRHPLLKEYIAYRRREIALALSKIGDADSVRRGECEKLIRLYDKTAEEIYG